MVAWSCFPAQAPAQTPPVAQNLATGIGQLRFGDSFTAVLTLNQVVGARKQTALLEDFT